MTSSTEEKPAGFWAQVFESLAPKANRVIAVVAGVRTFRQGLTGSAIVAAGGGISLTAVGLTEINWQGVALAVAAVALTSLIAAFAAFENVLQNGLSKKYTEAVVSQITDSGRAPSSELADSVTEAAAAIKAA